MTCHFTRYRAEPDRRDDPGRGRTIPHRLLGFSLVDAHQLWLLLLWFRLFLLENGGRHAGVVEIFLQALLARNAFLTHLAQVDVIVARRWCGLAHFGRDSDMSVGCARGGRGSLG